MRRKFDAATLFEKHRHDPKLVPYKTLKSVLDAVRSKKKALYFTGFPISCFGSGDPDFGELVHMAVERDLAVLIHNHRNSFPLERQEPDVFVLPLDQAWRVSALAALNETAFEGERRWSAAAEAQRSHLLGYTAKQRADWLASHRERRPVSGCNTIYTLLTKDQRQTVLDVGKRCFGSADSLDGMHFFFHRQHEYVKRNAASLVPKGLTLARVGLAWKVTWTLFGHFKEWKPRGLVSATISKKLAPTVTAGFESNVQFLTRRGWK
ncbi:MAG: hypothetical protein ACM31C_12675 [Acidobacteriota bacterium]